MSRAAGTLPLDEAGGETGDDAAVAMDRMYRHQRHLYDQTRKFFLLGRDELIAELRPPPGGRVLEIGCGTGRNLVRAARAYPGAQLLGLDVSAAMLATARRAIGRDGLEDRVRIARADATAFEPEGLFGARGFERVFISYALSMIPGWVAVLERAAASLAPGGSLHVVDFGNASALPGPVRAALRAWLARFDVTPRLDLPTRLAALAAARGQPLQVRTSRRGYVVHGVLGGASA